MPGSPRGEHPRCPSGLGPEGDAIGDLHDVTGYTSVNAIVKAELFPAEIRALGVGLGYALANSVFGGTAPMLYQASKPDHVALFIVYVTVMIGVSLLAYIFGLKNKGETVLDREQGSAWALPVAR